MLRHRLAGKLQKGAVCLSCLLTVSLYLGRSPSIHNLRIPKLLLYWVFLFKDQLSDQRKDNGNNSILSSRRDDIYVSLIYLETLEIFHASKLGTISEQSFTKCLFEVE